MPLRGSLSKSQIHMSRLSVSATFLDHTPVLSRRTSQLAHLIQMKCNRDILGHLRT
jgi:hypothetical protein